MTTTARRKITISGNWRDDGPENEWAGSGTVDQHGCVGCGVGCGEPAYDLIEEAIADGDEEGSVTVYSDELGRDVTYTFKIESE